MSDPEKDKDKAKLRKKNIRWLKCLACGMVVIVVGVLISKGHHWSVGNYWALGLAGSAVSCFIYTFFEVKDAPRIEKSRDRNKR